MVATLCGSEPSLVTSVEPGSWRVQSTSKIAQFEILGEWPRD